MKWIFIVYTIVSTIILIGLMFICSQTKQIMVKQIQDATDDSKEWMERMYVENNIHESINNNGYTFMIPDISKEIPLLVCYYSALSCGTCVDFAINKIDEYFSDSIQNSHVLFIASDFNEKTKFKKKNTMRISSRDIELPINESATVCFFVLQNNIVEHFFIPEKTFADYTDVYLKRIKEKISYDYF